MYILAQERNWFCNHILFTPGGQAKKMQIAEVTASSWFCHIPWLLLRFLYIKVGFDPAFYANAKNIWGSMGSTLQPKPASTQDFLKEIVGCVLGLCDVGLVSENVGVLCAANSWIFGTISSTSFGYWLAVGICGLGFGVQYANILNQKLLLLNLLFLFNWTSLGDLKN